jgi:hemolysin activation/secretion protein
MDVALNVDDHLPLHGSLELNNQYSSDTEPLRLMGALSYNNLFAALDSVAAQFTTSPQDTSQVQVLNVSYGLRPLGSDNLRTNFSFTNSASNVATIGTLGVLGDGQVYGVHLTWPMVSQPGEVQSLTAGVDYKHFRNTINLGGSDSQPASSLIEPVAYADLSATYAALWQWLSGSGRPLHSLAVDLSFIGGPRGITNDTLNFDNSRYQARGNFSYLRGDFSFTTLLPARLQLIVRGAGQATQDPLVVYEQQSISGADGVRGYLEAEVLADDAVKGTVQLQSPSFSFHRLGSGDGFLFFDAGHAHYLAPLPGQPDDTDLRSLGAGLDLLPGHGVSGSLTWAYPLTSGPDTRAHDWRLLFDVKGQF